MHTHRIVAAAFGLAALLVPTAPVAAAGAPAVAAGHRTAAVQVIPTTTTFATAGCSTWTVPATVTSLTVAATGAAGEGTGGGHGDQLTADLAVSSGQTYDVCVDSGGGAASALGSGGGGASGIAYGSDFTNPLVVAGGGGGAGFGLACSGAGGDAQTPGADCQPNPRQPALSTGGGGGGASTPGAGGTAQSAKYSLNGQSGQAWTASGPGVGGAAELTNGGMVGGAGGGGIYGGGSGGAFDDELTLLTGSGGGGGGDFCASGPSVVVTNCATTAGAGTSATAGTAAGDAQVTLTYIVPTAPDAPGPVALGTPPVGDGSLTVTWSAPANDGGSPVTSYDVAIGSSPTGPFTPAAGCTGIAAPTTSCTATGLTNGTPYYVEVKATNVVGTSTPSPVGGPFVPATVPDAPGTPTFTTVGDGFVVLSWSAPLNDGGSPIINFFVTQSTSAAGPFTPIAGGGGVTGSTATATGLTNGTPYYFEVEAENAQGFSVPSGIGGPYAAAPAPVARPGYWMAAADGGVFSLGGAPYYGSMGGQHLNAPVVGIAATWGSSHGAAPHSAGPGTATGYDEVAADGGIFTFGSAGFYGSMGGKPLNQPVVGLAVDATQGGYWEVAEDGGVFAFGDAPYVGSLPALGAHVTDIVGMAATSDRQGYWLVGADGAVYAFGDAHYAGNATGSSPVTGIAGYGNTGYWVSHADGTVAALGTALPLGAVTNPAAPVVGISSGVGFSQGFVLAGADGGAFAYGTSPFAGSMAGKPLAAPVVGVAVAALPVP